MTSAERKRYRRLQSHLRAQLLAATTAALLVLAWVTSGWTLSDVLFMLPAWVVTGCVFLLPAVAVCVPACVAAGRADRRIESLEDHLAARLDDRLREDAEVARLDALREMP
jgi:hypothetical protein